MRTEHVSSLGSQINKNGPFVDNDPEVFPSVWVRTSCSLVPSHLFPEEDEAAEAMTSIWFILFYVMSTYEMLLVMCERSLTSVNGCCLDTLIYNLICDKIVDHKTCK